MPFHFSASITRVVIPALVAFAGFSSAAFAVGELQTNGYLPAITCSSQGTNIVTVYMGPEGVAGLTVKGTDYLLDERRALQLPVAEMKPVTGSSDVSKASISYKSDWEISEIRFFTLESYESQVTFAGETQTMKCAWSAGL